ncbi:MAG TPA: RNA ligase family protein [Candidatus Saccharimonadales bacterium]
MIKLPRTLHIEGSRLKAGQVDPEAVEFLKLSGQYLVIEEKVDGTGVSIFFDDDLNVQVWHRGSPAIGKEFNQLHIWIKLHLDELFNLLEDRFILFGEWMMNKHSVFYDQLSHYFLESDIYDRKANIFLSTMGRVMLLTGHHYIFSVPVIAAFEPTSLSQITNCVGKSRYQSHKWREALCNKCDVTGQNLEQVLQETDQSGLMEGLYIKNESDRKVDHRYKYVRHEFLETILNSGSHIRDREPITNISL